MTRPTARRSRRAGTLHRAAWRALSARLEQAGPTVTVAFDTLPAKRTVMVLGIDPRLEPRFDLD